MSPPEIVLALALLAFSGWMLYEHGRISRESDDLAVRWLEYVGRVDADIVGVIERLGHLEDWRSGYPDTPPPPNILSRMVELELWRSELPPDPAPRIAALEDSGAIVQRAVRALAEAYKNGESVARDNALRISLLESPPRNNSAPSSPVSLSVGPGIHPHVPYVYHVDDDGTEHFACRLCSIVLGPKVS